MLMPTRASRTFLQRAGLELTVARPLPTAAPATMIFHRIPLVPPLPHPELLLRDEGTPPPDRGPTHSWPHESGETP